MAAAPWRCSQCGTINEPVANSCRTCGRWPSLFDLQESAVDEPSSGAARETTFEAGTFEPQPYRPETFRPETYRPDPVASEPAAPEGVDVDHVPDGAHEPQSSGERMRRVVTSLIVPLAFVLYIVISILFGDRGSG